MSNKLTNVFCWKPTPGNYWRCYEGVSGITVDAESKEAAVDHFNSIWNFRTPLQWIYEAPKRPKRPDDPKPATAVIEGAGDAAKFHRLILRNFHPDLHGPKKRWSATEITALVNAAWEQSGNG